LSAATETIPAAVRLMHFSDIHLTAPDCVWRPGDYFNKRMAAWVNLRLFGRGRHFEHAERVVKALAADMRSRGYDGVVFSGDATALGCAAEVRRAVELLGVGEGAPPGLAVPGNHDYCTPADVKAGVFEKLFAPWQRGEREGEFVYPFAQRVGGLWLVAVNSARANFWAWDASGCVGQEQLGRLERLLGRLQGGPRILVTHYPVRIGSGEREPAFRGLRDLDELVTVCRGGGIGLWLHGHRHGAFHHAASEAAGFPVICAGSATQTGRWSYGEYTVRGRELEAVVRGFDERVGAFRDVEGWKVEVGR
jgi:predicted MPP superfamily phosphohydrolase